MKDDLYFLIGIGLAIFLYSKQYTQPGQPGFVGPVQQPSPSGNVILGPVQSITPVVDEWIGY